MSQIEMFSYGSLSPELQVEVKAATERIKLRMKRTAEDIIEIGKDLIAVKARLSHGQFLPWIQAEFEMSRHTAENFIRIAERFPENDKVYHFKPSVLYALAAPSTPNEVVEEAVKKAEAGESVTVAEVKKLKAELAAKDSRLQQVESEQQSMQKRIQDLVMVVNSEREKLDKVEEEKQQAIAKAVAAKEAELQKEVERKSQEVERKTQEVEAERKRLEQFKNNPDPETAKKAKEAQVQLAKLRFELERAQSKLQELQDKENNAKIAVIKLDRFKGAVRKLISEHADALIEMSSPYLPESALCDMETLAIALEDLAAKVRSVAYSSEQSGRSMRVVEAEVLS